jgi:hypothetical protein
MKLTSIYEKLILEYYDSERLYDYDVIVSRLIKAPRYMHQYIDGLPHLECTNGTVTKICTRIPEVVYNYLFGNF